MVLVNGRDGVDSGISAVGRQWAPNNGMSIAPQTSKRIADGHCPAGLAARSQLRETDSRLGRTAQRYRARLSTGDDNLSVLAVVTAFLEA